jgi:hypothetical protein
MFIIKFYDSTVEREKRPWFGGGNDYGPDNWSRGYANSKNWNFSPGRIASASQSSLKEKVLINVWWDYCEGKDEYRITVKSHGYFEGSGLQRIDGRDNAREEEQVDQFDYNRIGPNEDIYEASNFPVNR